MTTKDIRPYLRNFLLEDAAIAALVATRIFPSVIPQGIRLACLVYNKISNPQDYHHTGPIDLEAPRFQIDSYAPKADAADELSRAVKDRLSGYRGTFADASSPPVTINVQGVFCVREAGNYNNRQSGTLNAVGIDSELKYRVSQDYIIWFQARD